MGIGEPGVRRGDDEIAGEREFEAGGHGVAIDRCDDRAFEGRDGVAHVLTDGALVEAGGPRGTAAQFLEVHAGAEGPSRAGDDRDADLRIGLQLPKRLTEPEAQLGRQRIHRLGSVERDGGDSVALLDQQHG